MSHLVASVAVLVAFLAAACSSGLAAPSAAPSATPSTDRVELSVFGAASLKDVLAAVRSAYEATLPGTTLTIVADSSSTLRTQIERGAPADLFLSADRQNPQALAEAGLTDGDPVDFARNRLTIIVPADDPAGIAGPADLARSGIKIIAAGDGVPITAYARAVVGNLATLPGYPPDFATSYASNVVSREENVKAIVAKIELGEGDAALVYVTDAMASSGVKAVEIPPEANMQATYAGVVIEASPHPVQAHAFLAWLTGPDGSAILRSFGFQPLT